MKATDLQIGDWVTFKDCKNGELVPIKIVGIHNDEECCAKVDNSSQGLDLLDVSDLTGIPITPEILEKNGFEKDPESGEMIWTDDNVTEVVCVGTILTISGEYANAEFATCMFIHELQHSLRLCGIEQEIQL